MPMKITDLEKFSKQNPDINLNVFAYDETEKAFELGVEIPGEPPPSKFEIRKEIRNSIYPLYSLHFTSNVFGRYFPCPLPFWKC